MIHDLSGKRVVIAGLGLFGGGLGAARWALSKGALVTVTDLRDASVLAPTLAQLSSAPGSERLTLALGGHEARDFEHADLVILNPGIPPTAKVMELAEDSPAQLTTATALTLELARCRVAAVTGTQGKSSTATFLAQTLRQSGRRVELGGNIGGSLLETVPGLAPEDVLVLELSSYQLHHMPAEPSRTLDLAAITNIGSDHLAWHGSADAYHGAKHRIWSLVRRGGIALAPAELRAITSEIVGPKVRLRTHGPGADARVGKNGEFLLGETVLGRVDELRVPGDFQKHNVACALAAAHLLGATPSECASAVPILSGLPHRMEPLGTWKTTGHLGPRRFSVIDNGISTTPESTLAAMASIDGGPQMGSQKLLLVGGAPKRGLEFGALARHAAKHGWIVAPFGAAEPEIRTALAKGGAKALGRALGEGPGVTPSRHASPDEPTEGPMGELWQRVLGALEEDALVLFSPACASFDSYANFQSRAVAFRASLRAIATERKNTRD